MNIYFTIGVVFMCIAIIITFVSSFYETESFIEKLSVKIASIIQILFIIGLLITYQSYKDTSRDQEISHQSALNEKNWSDIFKVMKDNFKDCPNFVNSLSYPWQQDFGSSVPFPIQVDYSTSTPDKFEAIQNVSIAIFQSFENVLQFYLNYDGTDLKLWINAFIIWANSDVLYSMWKKYDFMYDKYTKMFVREIFDTVRSKRPTDGSDIMGLSEEICNSSVIKEIFKSVDKEPPCH